MDEESDRSTGRSGLAIALVGAMASILIAFITTWGTIKGSENRLSDAASKVEEISETTEQLRSNLGVPLGTIIASSLSPSSFSEVVGDDAVFNPEESVWSPADGRDVGRSRYGRLSTSDTAPDLRGLFLRGLNAFDPNRPRRDDKFSDPDDRTALSLQSDAFQGHWHQLLAGKNDSGSYHAPGDSRGHIGYSGSSSFEGRVQSPSPDKVNGDPRVDSETRPKNSAVYYYIRIN